MRLRVLDFLERQVDHLRRTQESDGTWPPNWYVARQAAEQHRNLTQDEIDQRVVVTGHHLEWLLRFPAEHPLSDAALARAASWLETQLAAAPQSTLAEQYCPYSHAAHVLQILYRPDCKSG